MKNSSLAEIKSGLLKAEKIMVTSHVSPDGDSIGSVLAVKFILDQLEKKNRIVLADGVPNCFSFLPAVEIVEEYSNEMEIDCDTAVVVDCGDRERMGQVNKLVEEVAIINLDHHLDNTYFGEYNLVQEAAATGEILYQLIEKLPDVEITDNLAWTLATAIITDTGFFKYSNTSSQTHRIMAELLNYDLDPTYINQKIFGTNSYAALLLRGTALDTLEVTPSGKVAWMKVSQQMLEESGATMEDTEGLVGYPRSLKGVEVGALFKEQASGEVKVSLRSNQYFPVNEVAHEFGGGGHPRAAGCLIKESLPTVQKQVVNRLEEEITTYQR